MLFNLVEDKLHQALALIAKSIIDVTALNQEHVHSNLERHRLSNLDDGCLVHVDFLLKVLSGEILLGDEYLDSFSLFQDEQEVIIDVHGQTDDLKVLLKGLRDLFFRFDHNFVIDLDVPEMHLVTSSDGVLWSWKVATLLYNEIDDLLKLVLNVFNWVVENNSWATILRFVVVIIFLDAQLKRNEVVLKWSVSIILSIDNLTWMWVFWIFVSLDELHIGVH